MNPIRGGRFQRAGVVFSRLRRKRLEMPVVEQFLSLIFFSLTEFSLIERLAPLQGCPSRYRTHAGWPAIAAEHGLTAYDTAYLELALRRHARLATLDDKLLAAARAAGVVIYRGPDAPRVVAPI